jgi:2-polyprenyl-3-methyl-5-hydroxy-6-metoxy-1,4-benzoquinol methylase
MFLRRSYSKELMDDFSIKDGELEAALVELHTINRFLGGNSVSREGINWFVDQHRSGVKILDIGGGSSDNLYSLNKKNINTVIFSADVNRYTCQYQKRTTGNDKIICADAFDLPFKSKAFDLIHISLFLHHFNENEIINLIKQFLLISERGIIINDLRRNIFAYLGIRILTMLFSQSRLVKNDGPLSVRRAFVKKDLLNILRHSGIGYYKIKRKWAFRFLIIIPVE